MQSCANACVLIIDLGAQQTGRGRDQNTQKQAEDIVRSDFSPSLNTDGLPKLEMSV